MSVASARHRVRDATRMTFDRTAVALGVLFLVVLVPAVLASQHVVAAGIEPNTYGLEGAQLGGVWVVLEVIGAAVLVGLLVAYRWLPEWVQDYVQTTGAAVILMGIGVLIHELGIFWEIIGVTVVTFFAVEAIREYDLWWVVNNLLVLVIAVVLAPIGASLGIEAMLVALVGLTGYDWYFADKKSWMLSLAGVLMRFHAPVMFIIPARPRVDWDELAKERPDLPDAIEEAEPRPEDPEEVGIKMGIGMADLLLPAMFAAAVAVEPSPLAIGGVPAAAIGVAVGVFIAAFRLRWKVMQASGAGMPPIAAGAIGGYAPFALLGWVVTLV